MTPVSLLASRPIHDNSTSPFVLSTAIDGSPDSCVGDESRSGADQLAPRLSERVKQTALGGCPAPSESHGYVTYRLPLPATI